ncbi:MAG: hypothetical protein D6775_06525 [Caldilineae bacterium]|nr:MAG: hypothetical protein D6775_06525 [Caldilineae bacterium]
MVTWLDEQHRRDRNEITKLQQRIEAQNNEIQEQARRIKELEGRLASTQSQYNRINQLEEAIANLRQELVLKIDAQAEETARIQRESEGARMTDRETLTRNLLELRREIARIRPLEEEMAVRKAEDARLSEVVISLRQEIAALNKDIDDRTRSLPYLVEQRNNDNKRISQLQQENVELFKRVEEAASKIPLLEQKQLRIEGLANALPGMVTEMRENQEQFIEALKLADADRQRQMREWQEEFAEQQVVIQQMRERLQEFSATNEETKRVLAGIQQLQERLERDQRQVAELQRLAEDRQKRELENFVEDNEKRWKKQLLQWNFQWEQQAKINLSHKDQFAALEARLAAQRELIDLVWHTVEALSDAQLAAGQNWLQQLQQYAEQREQVLKKTDEQQQLA